MPPRRDAFAAVAEHARLQPGGAHRAPHHRGVRPEHRRRVPEPAALGPRARPSPSRGRSACAHIAGRMVFSRKKLAPRRKNVGGFPPIPGFETGLWVQCPGSPSGRWSARDACKGGSVSPPGRDAARPDTVPLPPPQLRGSPSPARPTDRPLTTMFTLRPCSRCGERCVSTPRNSYCKPCRAAYQRRVAPPPARGGAGRGRGLGAAAAARPPARDPHARRDDPLRPRLISGAGRARLPADQRGLSRREAESPGQGRERPEAHQFSWTLAPCTRLEPSARLRIWPPRMLMLPSGRRVMLARPQRSTTSRLALDHHPLAIRFGEQRRGLDQAEDERLPRLAVEPGDGHVGPRLTGLQRDKRKRRRPGRIVGGRGHARLSRRVETDEAVDREPSTGFGQSLGKIPHPARPSPRPRTSDLPRELGEVRRFRRAGRARSRSTPRPGRRPRRMPAAGRRR